MHFPFRTFERANAFFLCAAYLQKTHSKVAGGSLKPRTVRGPVDTV